MNINWLHLLLQRPLVTILLFALVSGCILVLLQTTAGVSQEEDDIHEAGLSLRDRLVEYEFYPKRRDGSSRYDIDTGDNNASSLALRIEDLKRIKLSVRNELRLLQHEKTKLLKEKASLINRNEKILTQISRSKFILKQLELDISANKKQRLEQSCSSDVVAPIVFNPMRSFNLSSYSFRDDVLLEEHNKPPTTHIQTFYTFDLITCPLTRSFSFSLTKTGEVLLSRLDNGNIDLTTLLLQVLQAHRQSSSDEHKQVCMNVILLDGTIPDTIPGTRNNLVINLLGKTIDDQTYGNLIRHSYVASSSFSRGTFRHNIDIVIPRILQAPENLNSIIGSIPLQSPLRRKYFASYFGDGAQVNGSIQLLAFEKTLQTIHRSSIDDMFLFIYECGATSNTACYNERERMIELSIFLVIIPDELYDIDHNTNDLLYMALARGSIPVIVGSERVRLPLDEAIDWRLAAVLLPSARLPELHFILRSMGPADLYSLKYYGRRILENYLATSEQIVDAIMSLISLNRLGFPPLPIEQTETSAYFSSQELNLDTNCTLTACQEAKSDAMMSNLLVSETLGPRERPFASPAFTRNFSLALTKTYDLWNEALMSPNYLFPSHPNDPVCPSEYKFMTSEQGYRPIGDGLGGSGSEFSRAIGGDRPNEQFTIVLLTHERVPLLMRTLERLKGMAYLNKVLVVWNGVNQKPHPDLVWPDIGVPIMLVKVDRNSLNNRFLPYDAIETDAIFSMDDDSPLRGDEIVFAFRVWRESRDRIVGFPGRFHAWDNNQNSWLYNSNHSCELSMVLTGGAFFHKYYSFAYSQIMPETIRSIVDKFMNCEDIAMNFLVAHLTRKPPIKVTSRWTFHCASCTSSLSEDNSHFLERHECMNIFTSIYGYMPLLNFQSRSDSILFKTRLPKDKQKCFKFV